MIRACGTAALALSLALPLGAQSAAGFGVHGSAGFVRLHNETTQGMRTSDGALFGADAAVVWRLLSLQGSFARGPIEDSGLSGVPRQLEQAEATIGIRPVQGFEVGTGVHSRAYVIDATAERWTAWQVHARYEVPLIDFYDIQVRAWAEGRGSLRGETNLGSDSFASWRGGAATFVIRPYGALEVRLRYDLDRVRLAGPRDETVEAFTLAVGLAR